MGLNVLAELNQPGRFKRALVLLCRRNCITVADFAREIERDYTTVARWCNGKVRINTAIAVGVCAAFNIDATDLVELARDASYIDQVAPRRHDINLVPQPGQRYLLYSTRSGRIQYVIMSPDGVFSLGPPDQTKACVFLPKDAENFIKTAPARLQLRRQLLVQNSMDNVPA